MLINDVTQTLGRDGECVVATGETWTTTLNATALAEPAVTVTVDGRTVRTVDQDETGAILYPIPNPIEIDG